TVTGSATAPDLATTVPSVASHPNDPTDGEALVRYLDQIADQPRLDASDERRLSAAIVAGHDAERQLQGDPFITDDAREVLLSVIASAADARRSLTQSSLRVVVDIAARSGRHGHDLLDLIQHGNAGLLRAADRFDASSGTSFSAYAAWWIRQAINEMPDPTGPIPRPTDPTWWDQLERERLDDTPPAPRRPPIATTGSDGHGHGHGSDTLSPYEQSAEALERQTLQMQLRRLRPAERAAVVSRLGLGDAIELDEADATSTRGMSRTHLRTVEELALSKLRHPTARRPWTNAPSTAV
ncbi:MAG TPA: sigma-70 family RNA polymerase sigma factor, partial [Ilumatobacteraceae bacterium]|nr:sigma-70 family RNA polymerase sigma factor [Ilumatobacteraceae bacterium]